jgi:predicted amidophosphoribosyltransferase
MRDTMNKQIEEMAREICACCTRLFTPCEKPICDTSIGTARHLYNAGYRKQSEGAWVATPNITISERGRRINSTLYVCSVCDKSNGRRMQNFCPNCGAKMKGGESDA